MEKFFFFFFFFLLIKLLDKKNNYGQPSVKLLDITGVFEDLYNNLPAGLWRQHLTFWHVRFPYKRAVCWLIDMATAIMWVNKLWTLQALFKSLNVVFLLLFRRRLHFFTYSQYISYISQSHPFYSILT